MFKDISWSLLEKVTKILISLVLGVVIARSLGPEDYGRYKYVMGLVLLFTPLATLGMESILIREFANFAERKSNIILNAVFLRLCLSGLILIILFLLSTFLSHDRALKLMIVIFSLVFTARSLEIYVFELKSRSLFKEQFVATALSVVITSIIKIVIILSKPNLIIELLLALNVLEALLIGTFAKMYYSSILKAKISIELIRELISKTWKQAIISSVIILYMKVDIIMIERLIDFAEVGKYSVAVTIAELWYFIPMSIVSVFYTKLVTKNNDISYIILLRILITISFLAIIGIYLLGEYFLGLFGNNYSDAISPLLVLMFSGLFVSLGLVQDKWYILNYREERLLLKTVMGLAVNIALNLLLVPIYGIQGAAIATLSGLIMSTLISDVLFGERRILNIKITAFRGILSDPLSIGAIKVFRKEYGRE